MMRDSTCGGLGADCLMVETLRYGAHKSKAASHNPKSEPGRWTLQTVKQTHVKFSVFRTQLSRRDLQTLGLPGEFNVEVFIV